MPLGHISFIPNTLDHSGRTHLSGVNARPWKINTSQPYLGSVERSPSVYLLSTPGSGPIARCTPSCCEQGGPSSTTTGWCRPSRAALLNWTSDKASGYTTTSRPISILAWWLVCKYQRPTQNKYPNLLVHWGLTETSRDSRSKVTPSPRLVDLRQGPRMPGRAT